MSIEIPGLILHRPLWACGDPVGSRMMGKTMIGGHEFWVDLLEVENHTMGHTDDHHYGTTDDNEAILTEVWQALALEGTDWNYIELCGVVNDDQGRPVTIDKSYWALLIYPAQS